MTRRYLVVDDNEAFAENLAEILRDQGAEVDVAGDGPAALERVAAARFDAVVTDVRMPGMSGVVLAVKARELDPGLPVVLLSAFTQDSQLALARRSGVLAVLPKPHQVPQLLQILGGARRGAVVIVDDDVALAENLAEALTARGLTAVTASSLSELDAVACRPFAALVDLLVPGGPLGEALERVRARFPGVPALVITAHADALPGGPDVFLKPFDTGALVARLEQLLPEDGA